MEAIAACRSSSHGAAVVMGGRGGEEGGVRVKVRMM